MDKNTQQPVAWIEACDLDDAATSCSVPVVIHGTQPDYDCVPLYTAPPVPRDVLMEFGVAVRDAIHEYNGVDISHAVDLASIADRYASKVQSDVELVSYAPDMATCTLRIGDEQYLFDRHVDHPQPVNQQLLVVAHDLDKFQRHYEQAAWQHGRMPGNELYSMLLMQIVNKARAAIAAAELSGNSGQLPAAEAAQKPESNQ